MLCNNPEMQLDWEMALPLALLSINTATCSSTGFTPYELLFGRKFDLMSNVLALRDISYADVLDRKLSKLEGLATAANAKQNNAKDNSKQRFDAAHVPRQFDVGDLVLIRRFGRISKLANRWDGPFEIKARANDIYTIEANKKNLERHAQDMKAYKLIVSTVIVASITRLLSAVPLVFER